MLVGNLFSTRISFSPDQEQKQRPHPMPNTDPGEAAAVGKAGAAGAELEAWAGPTLRRGENSSQPDRFQAMEPPRKCWFRDRSWEDGLRQTVVHLTLGTLNPGCCGAAREQKCRAQSWGKGWSQTEKAQQEKVPGAGGGERVYLKGGIKI